MQSETPAAESAKATEGNSLGRYRFLPWPMKIVYLLAPVAATLLFIVHWRSIPIFGHVLAGIPYYYLLYAILGINVFMGLGASSKASKKAPPWYDYVLTLALWAVTIFFLVNSNDIAYHNFDLPPNALVFGAAIVMGALGIEAGRRVAGWGYAAIMLVAIAYPLVASSHWLATHLGGVFYGVSFPLKAIFGSYAYGADGLLGIPARTLGEMVLGFFLFAGLVMGTGGGEYFMKLATSLMGRMRGGQAKGAVLASAFFGSITGSAFANVAGTGSFTIPAMKEAGYSPEYAAAIEACASTGSDTMPPILGGMVFIMVIIFGLDYADVVVATILPALLFYLGLLVQVDSYAARNNIKAVPAQNIPKWWRILPEGWPYLAGIGVLIYGLLYMRWGAITPIYASVAVLGLKIVEWAVKRLLPLKPGQVRKPVTESLKAASRSVETGLVQTAGLVNYTVAIFLGMGFIIVGLLKTGVAAGLTGWIISAGGHNLYLVLFVCVMFLAVMGMPELQRTAYIMLAIIAVPAISAISKAVPELAAYGGIPLIGLNLFFIFYATLGGITPPVAMNAFVAASIAGAHPMKTAWLACRLGVVLFFIPIFFVLQPALLIIYTPWWQTAIHFVQAAAGIWILSSALEGYLLRVGVLNKVQRVVLFAGGFMLAFPQVYVFGAGLCVCAATIAVSLRLKSPALAVAPSRELELIIKPVINGDEESL
jgi:TRAP transporter 4TM/12TM fusion protein